MYRTRVHNMAAIALHLMFLYITLSYPTFCIRLLAFLMCTICGILATDILRWLNAIHVADTAPRRAQYFRAWDCKLSPEKGLLYSCRLPHEWSMWRYVSQRNAGYKTYFGRLGLEGRKWMELAQNCVQWRALVLAVLNLLVLLPER